MAAFLPIVMAAFRPFMMAPARDRGGAGPHRRSAPPTVTPAAAVLRGFARTWTFAVVSAARHGLVILSIMTDLAGGRGTDRRPASPGQIRPAAPTSVPNLSGAGYRSGGGP